MTAHTGENKAAFHGRLGGRGDCQNELGAGEACLAVTVDQVHRQIVAVPARDINRTGKQLVAGKVVDVESLIAKILFIEGQRKETVDFVGFIVEGQEQGFIFSNPASFGLSAT